MSKADHTSYKYIPQDFATMKAKVSQGVEQEIAYLRTPIAIREKCQQLFDLACAGKSNNFDIDLSQLETVADYVIKVIRDEYPDLQIPFHSRWRHFEAGNVPRLQNLNLQLAGLSPTQIAQTKFDLAIISVLLDAGAGDIWQYEEQDTKTLFQRSEGLAVASFHMFCNGTFSSQPHQPYQADAPGLITLTATALESGLQVTTENPLVGVTGRLGLLQKLGQVLLNYPEFFGTETPRPGNLVNYLLSKVEQNQLAAPTVLLAVLEGLGDIWSGRIEVAGVNLGDVWQHSAVGLVPFHKLSQWLTYSLLEPLQELGLEITELEAMTGLPEYRNGGLCLDMGLLQPKNPDIMHKSHLVAAEVIVEWRALTVILLDYIADAVRQKLNMNAQELPLVKILQGGTWTAGRRIATKLRKGGVSPIQIQSDGTVF